MSEVRELYLHKSPDIVVVDGPRRTLYSVYDNCIWQTALTERAALYDHLMGVPIIAAFPPGLMQMCAEYVNQPFGHTWPILPNVVVKDLAVDPTNGRVVWSTTRTVSIADPWNVEANGSMTPCSVEKVELPYQIGCVAVDEEGRIYWIQWMEEEKKSTKCSAMRYHVEKREKEESVITHTTHHSRFQRLGNGVMLTKQLKNGKLQVFLFGATSGHTPLSHCRLTFGAASETPLLEGRRAVAMCGGSQKIHYFCLSLDEYHSASIVGKSVRVSHVLFAPSLDWLLAFSDALVYCFPLHKANMKKFFTSLYAPTTEVQTTVWNTAALI